MRVVSLTLLCVLGIWVQTLARVDREMNFFSAELRDSPPGTPLDRARPPGTMPSKCGWRDGKFSI